MITLTPNQTATLVNLLVTNGISQKALAAELGLTNSAVFKLCCMATVQSRAETLVVDLGNAVAALPTEHQRILYSLGDCDDMVFRLAIRLAGQVGTTEFRRTCSKVRKMDRKSAIVLLKEEVARP